MDLKAIKESNVRITFAFAERAVGVRQFERKERDAGTVAMKRLF